MCRLFTGAGKTFIASLMAQRWIQRGDDYHVIVIAHERQLVQQFAGEVRRAINIRPGIEMADEKVRAWSLPRIVVASRATLMLRTKEDEEGRSLAESRLFKFDHGLNWLVIFDEAHKHVQSLKSVKHIVEHFAQNPKSRRLGITATPERTDKRTLGKMFPGVAIDYRLCSIDPTERNAVEEGYAVPYDQRYIKVTNVDFKAIREIAGDFDQDELARLLSEQETLASLCNPLIDLVGKRRTIIFNVNRDMAKKVSHFLNAHYGQEVSAWLDGECKEVDRRKIFHRHQNGQLQFLSVCGLCREGYDDPAIQCVAIFRPTKSRPLAEQMKGRGCRPLKGLVEGLPSSAERKSAINQSDKPSCLICDLVGATGLGDCASTAHIYAHGIPDEVVQRAQRKALEGETDWKKAFEDAKTELSQEEKIEEERRAKIRAAKLAKAQARVEYTQTQVNGQMAARSNRHGGYRMPFGKFQGHPMSSIPAGYLAWMQSEIKSGVVRRFADLEIQNRIMRGDSAMIQAVQRFAQSKETA